MIGFNRLGNYGRLGNQMFQYAALRGIAAKRNLSWCVPPAEMFGLSDHKVKETNSNLYDCFNLASIEHYGILDGPEYVNESSRYDPYVFTINDNTSIAGYFQSEKYFEHIADEIKADFTFKPSITAKAAQIVAAHRTEKPLVSVHVRRSDYLHNPEVHTDLFNSGYYHRAFDSILTDADYLIVSDDPDWCNQQDIFHGANKIFVSGNHSFVDMCVMSMCDAHIIANSSFSWWASYLSDNQTIAPANWFGTAVDFDPTDYLYRKKWTVV